MRLFEIYAKETIKEFISSLEEDFQPNKDLDSLLKIANERVFKPFGINPNEKKYFIAGSARLYLYPKLKELFNLDATIGDIDIVIPYKELWVNAGLEKEWNSGGIYRPNNDKLVEAFALWDPSKAGGEYASVRIRSTTSILLDATSINGHYFMSLGDILDYKMALDRDKEHEIVNIVSQYQHQNIVGREAVLRRIAKMIGLDKTKEFLGTIKR